MFDDFWSGCSLNLVLFSCQAAEAPVDRSKLASRRGTNNPVSSLEDQAAVIEQVLASQSDTEVQGKAKKSLTKKTLKEKKKGVSRQVTQLQDVAVEQDVPR